MDIKVIPYLTNNSRRDNDDCSNASHQDIDESYDPLLNVHSPYRSSSAIARRNTAQKRSAFVVQERDLALLCDLLTYGAMLGEHIHALYFDGRSRRRMNQRLQQLQYAGLVIRRPLPLGLSAALPLGGSMLWVYGLGSVGAPLVAAHLQWDLADVRRLVRLGTPTAAAHTLEIVRLRLQAEDAARQYKEHGEAKKHGWKESMPEAERPVPKTEFLKVEFLPERLLRHAYQVRAVGGTWRDEVYKPDALLKLAFAGDPWRHFFAEIDCGNTSAPEWGVKAFIALRYSRAGLFQKRYGADDFRTLIVTTGRRRLAHLSQLLIRQTGPEDAARFALTTFSAIAEAGLLAPVWQVPGIEGPLSLEDWSSALA